jgi:O-antigen/teichoic acid export membrane protein
MGIVKNQSIKNTIITFIGFGIGAINALFLYTNFLGKLHYGIVATVLSGANIMMPFMAFGIHNTLIRFFSRYKTEKEKEAFLTFSLFFPLLFIIPFLILFFGFQDQFFGLWKRNNPELKPYFLLIPFVGFCMGYFEIFYAWVKVKMQSVVGNLLSEVFGRVIIMLLLFGLHFQLYSKETFIYFVAFAYFLQLLSMCIYAFSIQKPVFRFIIPVNLKEIFHYSFFIIVSGGVAVMLVDFDKVMIPMYKTISENAEYGVAIFISTVIIVPSRAMNQIIAPITAKLINENKWVELNDLYKKSAINLQVIGGLLMLGIFLNIKQLYLIIPDNYSGGTTVVFMIGLSKFYDLILGNNNSIIVNTKYYRMVLLFGLFTVLLMIGLNMIFIPLYGIEGSAFATLVTVLIYNTIKLLFVIKKMNLYPFTIKTLQSFGILLLVFFGFYFWDFNFHPIINIGLKSIIITTVYLFLNYKLKISEDVNEIIDKYLK